MSRFQRILIGLFCAAVALWLVAPTLIIVPISFAEKKSLAFPPDGFSLQWYANLIRNPEWSNSILNSLQIATIVSVVATVIGTLAAIGIARMKSRGGGVIRAILITPMIVPGVVMAIGIYAVYLDHQLVGSLTGYVAAHSMLAIPFVIIAVGASLSVFDTRLETAAASLGASRITTFFTITLPLIAPGVLSGLLFAFVTSFDEVIVALFINSPSRKTLPVQIFASMTRDSDPTVAAVGTLIFLLTSLIIAAGLWFGTAQTMPFLVATVLAGGGLAIAVAVWSLIMTVFEIHGPGENTRLVRVARKIRPKLPYGFAFAIGAIVAFPQSWWMTGAA